MKHSLYNKGHRDANEQEILDLLNARNVAFTMLGPGEGADLIVWIHPMEAWEIKNPEQPANKQAMTEAERARLTYCTATHIPYCVIKTVEDAAHRLNEYFGRL
jgi:hypothetical protein